MTRRGEDSRGRSGSPRRVALMRSARSGLQCRFSDAGFEIGDAPVLEAQVRAGGLEPFVEGAW
jgi:hypothetical protein